MAEEVTLTELIGIISRLQLNYTFLAKSWYDIFYNPTPIEKIDINYYDDSGKLQTDTIPNLAYARNHFLSGEGDPEGVMSGPVGTIYQDLTNGEAYIKHYGEDDSVTGWIRFISSADLDKIIIYGSSTPEGRVTAAPGTLYVDQDNNKAFLYMKRSTTGNTGWERIDSYPTSFVRQTFNVPQRTEQVKLSMKVDNKTLVSVYIDGTLLSDTRYRLWNDQQTIEFGSYNNNDEFVKDPIVSPDTEETIEVIVQYYTDIHLYDGEVTQEYVDLLAECQAINANVSNLATETITNMRQIYEAFELDIETAVEDAEVYLMERIQGDVDRLEAIANKTETELTNMSDEVKSEYRDISSWYTKVSQMQVSVAEMQRDVATMKSTIMTNSHYIWARSLENDIMLISNYDPEETGFTLKYLDDKIISEDSALRDEMINNIARVDRDMEDKEGRLQSEIDNTNNMLITTDTELRDLIGALDETNNNEHLIFTNDIDDIKMNYFNRQNMPIGIKAVYQFNKNVNTDAKSAVTPDIISIDLKRDCLYYTVDIGEIMEGIGHNVTFNTFELTPGDTFDGAPASDLDPEVEPGDKINTRTYSNVVIQAKVLLVNESEYKPIINWGNDYIFWLGNEEPDLEPGKNYLLEFISYDNGISWFSHVMGICQPAINTEDLSLVFKLTITNGTGDGEYDIYYDTEDSQRLYFGTYTSVNNKINITEDVSRKYKGTVIKNLRLHKVEEDDEFYKHKVNNGVEFTISEDTQISTTINWNNRVKDTYTYNIRTIVYEIEDKMIQTETVKASAMTLADLKNYVNGDAIHGVRQIELQQIQEGSVVARGKVTRITEEYDTETGSNEDIVYYSIYDPEEEEWGDEIENTFDEFKRNAELVMVIKSDCYRAATDTYEFSDFQMKFMFEDGTTYEPNSPAFTNAKYVVDPKNSYVSGVTITLNTDDDIAVFGHVLEKAHRADGMLTCVKLKLNHATLVAWGLDSVYTDEQCYISDSSFSRELSLDDNTTATLSTIGSF